LLIASSFSNIARHDLIKTLVAAGQVPPYAKVWEVWGGLTGGETWPEYAAIVLSRNEHERTRDVYLQRQLLALLNWRIDSILSDVLSEMSQLASRLLVKNKELYGRYDRFKSEASFRMNVSISLLAALFTATYLSHIQGWVKAVLILVELTAAMLLFRQGLLRAISARDVIAQAIVIGEVESEYIKPAKTGESAPGSAAAKQSESSSAMRPRAAVNEEVARKSRDDDEKKDREAEAGAAHGQHVPGTRPTTEAAGK
jgi:hypothetical protein